MEIREEKGTNTIYLPGKEISDETRGPLLEIGSLATWTRMFFPGA